MSAAPRFRPTLLLLAALSACSAGALQVRVLVVSGPQVTVRVPLPAPERGSALGSGPLGAPAPLPSAAWIVGVTPDGSRLTLNGQDAGNVALYLPPAPGSVVEISSRTYRGGVQLRVQDGGVQAINVLDVEDYLRSVVPAEMPTSWPAAALGAQAVIARTYVAARVNPAAPFDTCATERCQVYPGVRAETPSSDAAVASTRGQVVAYGGQPASTYFSSDSGGYTASSAEVWGQALPYLPAQSDPFSGGSPRARWRLEVGAAKVAEVAARYHVQVGALRGVAITRLSPSGRPLEITLSGAAGTGRIDGANAGGFVRSLGAAGTRVTLDASALPAGGPLVVEGSGAGHGVGLSQYGALGLARQGYSHLHVLGFYYPGTSLSVLSGGPVGRPALLAGTDLPHPDRSVLARAGHDLMGGVQ